MNKVIKIFAGISVILAIVVGVYLYSQYDPEKYLLFPKCPVYTLTGYKCPGCGSQRAFHNLFQGNLMTAFMYNPFMILLVPYVLLGISIEYIANRLNPIVVRLRSIFFGKWALLVLAVIVVLYTVLRNINN